MTKTFKEMTIAEKFMAISNEIENEEMSLFLVQRAKMQEKSNISRATNSSTKPTKAQEENMELAEKVKAWVVKTRIDPKVPFLFDMKSALEGIGEKRTGKGVSVARILVNEGFMKDAGQIQVGKGKRKGYEA